MAANVSPTLTSTSHTLSAQNNTMAPTSATLLNGQPAGSMPGGGSADILLSSLRPENRHVFLQPPTTLSTQSLRLVQTTLEAFAGDVADEQARRLRQSRKQKKRKTRDDDEGEIEVLKMRKVWVDGFDTGQVWQQAKRIIGGVLRFSDGVLGEMQESGELVDVDEAASEEDEDEEADETELSHIVEGNDQAEATDETGSEDKDDEEDLDEKELVDDEPSQESFLDEDEDGELSGQEPDNVEPEEYIADPNGLNDGFFSIDEFNRQSQYYEDQDARGDPNTDHLSDDEEIDWNIDPLSAPAGGAKATKSKRRDGNALSDEEEEEDEDDDDDEDDGPTFGDMALDAPEGDSEDDAMLDDVDPEDETNDFNANEIYFKDFFAPPPKKSTGAKPKRTVKFKPEQPDVKDVERAIEDVRRDLFEDESEISDSDDALSDVSAGDPKSRRSAHERRQAKLAEEIRKLESASVAKREWTLAGEAAAVDRPVNSLLEQDLDFEHVGKPVPVITPEITESMEDLIKRRILAQEFDEVVRRRPDTEGVPSGTRRGMLELDDSKPNKSLAEIYEEEHVKNADPDGYVSKTDEKLQKEELEIQNMWRDVSARLDALSSWHFRPKPSAPTLSVVADVGTVSMEDAQPTTASGMAGSSSRMAPQEVYKSGGKDNTIRGEVVTKSGLPMAKQELSREDKQRRRRREKERVRKAGGVGSDANGKTKQLSKRAQMQRDTMADLKKGGVRVINRKGEITDVAGKKAKPTKAPSSGNYKL